MQIDPTHFRIARKICIECEDRYPMPIRHGADQKIDVRPLDATRSALIEEASGALIGSGVGTQVIERAELVPKPVKLSRGCNAAQNFLSDAARHARARFIDESRQFPNARLLPRAELGAGAAPECNGPHGRVDEDIHRCRPCLWSYPLS